MLTIHRAERADRLVAALADVLSRPLEDPFTPEIVAVPSRGIERWLTQQLSGVLGASPGRGDGVCANVAFPFPGRLAGAALAAAAGITPDEDPWLPARSVWPLMGVVDEHIEAPWMATLAAHLGHAGGTVDATRRGAAGSPSCATWPTSSTATAFTGRRCSRRGPSGTTPTASVRHFRPTSPGRPRCGAACAPGSASPALRNGSVRRAPGCARSRSSSRCRRACRCSG